MNFSVSWLSATWKFVRRLIAHQDQRLIADHAALALALARKPIITARVRNEPLGEDGALRGKLVVINRSSHVAVNLEAWVYFRGNRGVQHGTRKQLIPHELTEDSSVWYLDLGEQLSDAEATRWRGMERIVVRYSDVTGAGRWEYTEVWPLWLDEVIPTPMPGCKVTDELIS